MKKFKELSEEGCELIYAIYVLSAVFVILGIALAAVTIAALIKFLF